MPEQTLTQPLPLQRGGAGKANGKLRGLLWGRNRESEREAMAEKMLARRQRFQLALPLWVRLWERLAASPRKKMELTEETITENISSEGCYFYLSKKPSVGAKATMEITVPGQAVGLKDSKVRASGKVVRVDEKRAEGKVGVACTIERFSFRSSSPKESAPKQIFPS